MSEMGVLRGLFCQWRNQRTLLPQPRQTHLVDNFLIREGTDEEDAKLSYIRARYLLVWLGLDCILRHRPAKKAAVASGTHIHPLALVRFLLSVCSLV